jgi:SAM-dependent methyltransferase
MSGTERVDGRAFPVSAPSAARVYDYLLDGIHNTAADRALGDLIIDQVPDAPMMAQANRAFLRRAVAYCIKSGVSQFLDLGSGIPTQGPVHEVARGLDEHSRVVCVDFDPGVIAQSQLLLAGDPRTAVLLEDVRDPEAILGSPQVRDVLDLSRPVALLMVAVLHFIRDEDDPMGLVKRFAAELAPGSLLVLSHGARDADENVAATASTLYSKTQTPGFPRTREEVAQFFEGFEMIEPGVVWAPMWRPETSIRAGDDPARSCVYAGVGCKA